MHRCTDEFSNGTYVAYSECGRAVTHCLSDEHGFLWAGNGEYESMVNFCPFCGAKAERAAICEAEWEEILDAK